MRANEDLTGQGHVKKLAIMQPYFMPYIGYFQLLSAVDEFVIYDNIKYTKKGWINRNRMLLNGRDVVFTLPLKGGSDFLDVRERCLSDSFVPTQMIRQFHEAYSKAPQVAEVMPLLENIFRFPENNLFKFIHHSVQAVCDYLEIKTKIVISSEVEVNHQLKSQDKVLAICRARGASHYINAIGGQALYDREVFQAHAIDLKFIQTLPIEYPQFSPAAFVPWLSIVDCMMFNSKHTLQQWVRNRYNLL